MVPDLVVLQVLDAHRLQPAELGVDVLVQLLQDLGPVQPDGVVCRVHGDDVVRQVQAALRVFVDRHDGAQVGHGLAVFLGVGDGCEGGAGPGAFVERDGCDVGPCGRG